MIELERALRHASENMRAFSCPNQTASESKNGNQPEAEDEVYATRIPKVDRKTKLARNGY